MALGFHIHGPSVDRETLISRAGGGTIPHTIRPTSRGGGTRIARRRSRRGSGHIYRRGAVYWFKFFDAGGKPHWRSSGSRERAVAEAMLRDQLGQRDRGGPALPDPRRIAVDTLLDNLLAEYRLNEVQRRQLRVDEQMVMTRVLAVGSGGCNTHVPQTEINLQVWRHGRSIFEIDEIDLSTGS